MKATTKTLLALSTCLLTTAACSPGEITGGGTDSPDAAPVVTQPDAAPPPTGYTLAVAPQDPAAEVRLGTTTLYNVTITSVNKYAGDIALAAAGTLQSGAQAGWNVTFEPATVTVAADGTATAVMSVAIPSDGIVEGNGIDPSPANFTVSGTATPAADNGDATGPLTIMSKNLMVVPIAAGAGANAAAHMFPQSTTIRLGARLSFYNADAANHAIHAAAGDVGFPHQNQAGMEQGGSYQVSIAAPGNYTYYCHNHDGGQRYTVQVVQ